MKETVEETVDTSTAYKLIVDSEGFISENAVLRNFPDCCQLASTMGPQWGVLENGQGGTSAGDDVHDVVETAHNPKLVP